MLVSTRKGLVIYDQQNGGWKQESLHFRGIPICLSYYNKDNHTLWAFQDHGHWGIKMSRSNDFGKTWEEVDAPTFSEGDEVKDGKPASLNYVWALQVCSLRLERNNIF